MSLRGILSCAKDALVVREPVDIEYQVTRILLENQGRVVRFMDLDGGEAVGNLYSTRERICTAL
ncbi:MAG TPA: UbiD family decarboxylase, partial [Methanomassiliicoccales archaeon]|nr:UbiD family decarboxylase [Methanomassiliicoccales archaeon]